MRYDAAVIGAGPGGSIAAYTLARAGKRVMLVERAEFPRWKVCGACLGALGVRTLRDAGLGGLLDDIGAQPIRSIRLAHRGRVSSVSPKGMVAVSRGALDTALADRATSAGAELRTQTVAEPDPEGRVMLRRDGQAETIDADAIVQATGLRPIAGAPKAKVSTRAYIGLGVAAQGNAIEPGVLLMAVGARGYVGVVRTEDGKDNWAAAVDPAFVRQAGSPAEAIGEILHESGQGRLSFPDDGWKGTPALTRRVPRVSGVIRRIGDAAGYIEPITGEGMSWALAGGVRAAEHVLNADAASSWDTGWKRLMLGKRSRCWAVSRGLRSPAAMRIVMSLLGTAPSLGSPVVASLIGGVSFDGSALGRAGQTR